MKQTSSVTGTHYYLQDHQGSTRALTDSSGNVSTKMNYDGYGNTTANSLTRYEYTGRELDPDTGLMYYRARWYDPQSGRFISEDPIGFGGGENWYSYVGNNPLRYRDPLGLTGEEVLQNPEYLRLLAAAFSMLGATAAAAAPPVAIGVGYVVVLTGAWYAGSWIADRPWNPFVNGPLNPFGTPPLPYYPPLRDLSKGRCDLPPTHPPPLVPPMITPFPQPIPFRGPPDNGRVFCYLKEPANANGYCLYQCYSSTGNQRWWIHESNFLGQPCPAIITR